MKIRPLNVVINDDYCTIHGAGTEFGILGNN